ncbi:protein kinase domain-containing protein [Actinomadura macrotermitis]|uniref:Beta-barrel assembly-enhancing protease n=1 Tax=Actinomadura macrotermitis TaxID=2585200 RepID=A0A7K0BLL8_9ACTN|nr:serine/threonine-protein kinase [Actinomadura macrotermitis]MQY02078.1 Beta-barrel assembly-enhancing protease [Actinomadura macrotermitis]
MRTPGELLADLFTDDTDDPAPSGTLGRLGDLDVIEVRRGGMGEVLICRSQVLDDALGAASGTLAYAYKSFQRQFFFSPQVRSAFLREVRHWSRLSGVPHIMPVLGLRTLDDRPFVIMPGIRGPLRTLRDVIDHLEPGPWSAAFLAAQVALGMQLAGERIDGLVHGDLKPENVLLFDNLAFVSDFGLARAAGENHGLTSTPAYRAPELLAGPAASSVASDVYAFGAMLWELLTGGLPGAEAPGDDPGLAELARSCLAEDPAERPASFAEIYHAILRIAGDRTTGLVTQIMEATARIHHVLAFMAPLLTAARMTNLIALEQYDLAIQEADDAAEPTARILSLRGHALSLSDRDEEALAAFDQALALGPDQGLVLDCVVGRGLSLKRLGRFDEAAEVLRNAAIGLPDGLRAEVLVNLGTVHLEQGEPARALAVFQLAAKLRPGLWAAWANVGQALGRIGDHRAAQSVYRHAVRMAPQEEMPALLLAAVCMDHLGEIGAAWAVLEQMDQQGLWSFDWAARSWACLLTDERLADRAARFERQIRETWPADADAIGERARQILAEMEVPDESGNVPDDPGPEPPAAKPYADFLKDLRESMPEGTEVGSGDQNGFEPPSDPAIAAGYTVARDGRYFLGIRQYQTSGYHCFDFYGPSDDAAYLDRLADFLTQAVTALETAEPATRRREIPPYYHRCPACGVLVLTDRTPGVLLRCRGCAQSAPTQPLRTPEFDALVQRAAEHLGFTIADVSGYEQLFLAALDDERLAEPAIMLAATLGFTPVGLQAPAPRDLLGWIRANRSPTFGDRETLVALRKTAADGALAYQGGGTPDLEELEFFLRTTLGLVLSASVFYDPDGGTPMEMRLTDRQEDLLQSIRAEVAADPHDLALRVALVRRLLRLGRIREALEEAAECTERWPEAAESWLARAEAQAAEGVAAEAVESVRRSLAADPVQPGAYRLLATCLFLLGDQESAAAAMHQAMGLGGGS